MTHSVEKELTTHYGILAWKISWMEEPGRLQSMWSQRVRHDWAASLSLLWASLIIFPWGTPVLTGFSWQGRRCVLSNTGFHSRKPPLSTWSATANIEFLVGYHTPLWSVSYLMATWLHWVSFTQDRQHFILTEIYRVWIQICLLRA